MQLQEVTTPGLEKQFIELNYTLNKENPQYIRPLDKDIRDVFSKQKNKAYRNGKLIRWVLFNETGEGIGRIAAFTNKKYKNKGDEFPVGGIGFFDCINDQRAADLLFDVARHWLIKEGMEAMDGPINFGSRDRWWGLLIEGFDREPNYQCNYNVTYKGVSSGRNKSTLMGLCEACDGWMVYAISCWAIRMSTLNLCVGMK